jgi:hypothetical protein
MPATDAPSATWGAAQRNPETIENQLLTGKKQASRTQRKTCRMRHRSVYWQSLRVCNNRNILPPKSRHRILKCQVIERKTRKNLTLDTGGIPTIPVPNLGPIGPGKVVLHVNASGGAVAIRIEFRDIVSREGLARQ